MTLNGTFLQVAICLVGISVATVNLFGQVKFKQHVPMNVAPTLHNYAVHPSLLNKQDPELTTAVSPLIPFESKVMPKVVEQVQANELGLKLGYSFYDFQTNGSMPNRLAYKKDGQDDFVQFLWMVSQNPARDPATRTPGFNSGRGTHYTGLIVTDPNEPVLGLENWVKCEARRSGWPSIVQFTGGEIGFTSHTPIAYYENIGFGTTPLSVVDVTTEADSANWPRLAAGGQEDLHLIYNKQVRGAALSDPSISQVVYRRSTNRGLDWSPEVLFSGANSVFGNLPVGNGGDTYALTAKGNTVVVTWVDNSLQVVTAISTNRGANWVASNATVVYEPTYKDIDSTIDAGVTIEVRTDTVLAPNGHMDVIIDKNNEIHYVFGVTPTHVIRTGTGTARRGTIFQSDGSKEFFYKNSSLAYRRSQDSTVYFMGAPDLSNWDGSGHVINRRPLDGVSRWPQLGLNENGDLYCVFGSFKPGDTKSVSVDTTGGATATEPDTLVSLDGFHGHVYATYKPAGIDRWSTPISITPDGVNCQYASLADEVSNGRMHIGYSVSATPGDRVTNVEMPVDTSNIYYYNLDATTLPLVNSIANVKELKANIVVSPNPTSETATVNISSVTNGKITVSLYTPLGQLIMRSTSSAELNEWNLNIPTAHLSSGSYICTIEQNGAIASRTVSILH